MAPKNNTSDEALIELLNDLDDEDLIEVLLKRNGKVDEEVIKRDVTERITHAGSVQSAYDHAYSQADEAMQECLAQVERLATQYEATFTVLDMLEDRLAEAPEEAPKPDDEEAPKPDLN